MSFYMYVSVREENRISVFKVNSDTGRFESQLDIAVPDHPSQLAVDPDHQFLFVGHRGPFKISSYRINRYSGELSFVSDVPLEDEPVYIITDRKGRFLLSSYYFTGKVAIHSISEQGRLGPPVQWLDTGLGAHSIQTDPSNRFAFVPHVAEVFQMSKTGRSTVKGPNVILQFKFNEVTGRLTPNLPYKVTADSNIGPRHFCFHPGLDVIYFSNEQGGSVTVYQFDTAAGTLSAKQTLSTLPDDYKGRTMSSDIQILPSGNYIYVVNRGYPSIACFASDHSGLLKRTGIVPTEEGTRTIALDPAGKYLFAPGEHSDRMASYRINSVSGGLELLETRDVGKAPMWVLTIKAE